MSWTSLTPFPNLSGDVTRPVARLPGGSGCERGACAVAVVAAPLVAGAGLVEGGDGAVVPLTAAEPVAADLDVGGGGGVLLAAVAAVDHVGATGDEVVDD